MALAPKVAWVLRFLQVTTEHRTSRECRPAELLKTLQMTQHRNAYGCRRRGEIWFVHSALQKCAGTLLQCTMNEPNFSSATTAIGDPVLCHLKSLEEFGRPAFPRGAMLGGHLEEAKDPGHLWGKGHLTITFDRVVLPYGDLPVPAKVIQAKGFKVNKTGDISGKGHAKRDVVEWMLPPLWPWKVISLPARGPRPRLKGEEPLHLRLMDDISI